jgi:NAD(P)-dependent dehydrogenase (short-subunit alcohol dehydrogenase family)
LEIRVSNKGLFDLTGKTVAVIGAASGIGEAVALGCARQGARVAALDVNLAAVTAVAERARSEGAQCDAGALDIRDGAAGDQAFDDSKARHGLDVVICTPSINVRKPILRYTDEELQRVLDVNIKGNFNVLRSAGRIMTAQEKGSIILYSSVRSQVIEPGQGVYAATKAGILQLVKTAAAEFGPHNVRVNAIGPGVIETPLTAPIKANKGWYDAYAAKSVFNRWGQPEELVGPSVFLASDSASYVTGTIIYADGGWLAADGRFTPPGM